MISLLSTSKRSGALVCGKLFNCWVRDGDACSSVCRCFPQGSSGRIIGTVTDQSGGVISGATVTVTDTEKACQKSW